MGLGVLAPGLFEGLNQCKNGIFLIKSKITHTKRISCHVLMISQSTTNKAKSKSSTKDLV